MQAQQPTNCMSYDAVQLEASQTAGPMRFRETKKKNSTLERSLLGLLAKIKRKLHPAPFF